MTTSIRSRVVIHGPCLDLPVVGGVGDYLRFARVMQGLFTGCCERWKRLGFGDGRGAIRILVAFEQKASNSLIIWVK